MNKEIKKKIIKAWIRIKKGHPVKAAIGQFEIYDRKKNATNQWTVDHSDKVVRALVSFQRSPKK